MRFNYLLTAMVAVTLSLTLAACAPSPLTATPGLATRENTTVIHTPVVATAPTADIAQDMFREDNQGAVTVSITPVNLDGAGDRLDFEVAMNTHSVDLSMDLATLATLETDTGLSVVPVIWDAPRGGHHVGGILSFPASVDGKPLLDGVKKLTLTIRAVDVPERVFVWELES